MHIKNLLLIFSIHICPDNLNNLPLSFTVIQVYITTSSRSICVFNLYIFRYTIPAILSNQDLCTLSRQESVGCLESALREYQDK